MPLYEIINISDPYTIKHDDQLTAIAATLIVGQGAYALHDAGTGECVLPILMFGGDAFVDRTFGDFAAWIDAHALAIADALDSVLYGSAQRRAVYDAAAAAITEPGKLEEFRRVWQDQRGSMNDIGGRAQAMAERLRKRANQVSADAIKTP